MDLALTLLNAHEVTSSCSCQNMQPLKIMGMYAGPRETTQLSIQSYAADIDPLLQILEREASRADTEAQTAQSADPSTDTKTTDTSTDSADAQRPEASSSEALSKEALFDQMWEARNGMRDFRLNRTRTVLSTVEHMVLSGILSIYDRIGSCVFMLLCNDHLIINADAGKAVLPYALVFQLEASANNNDDQQDANKKASNAVVDSPSQTPIDVLMSTSRIQTLFGDASSYASWCGIVKRGLQHRMRDIDEWMEASGDDHPDWIANGDFWTEVRKS
jgi:hypothetical protein